jgi:spore coat polysaccharide biosynthesis predicted glycosyltransferase SpsG
LRWQKNDSRLSELNAASKKVLIRCDGAPEIGFGHVVRCLALADELRNSYGCQVDFAMLQGPHGIVQVQAQGYAVYQPVDGAEVLEEGHWLQELITKNQHQVLVLDVRTDLASSAIHSIRASGVLIVTIDDPSERRLLADLAFYPPIPQAESLDWTGFTGKRFVGWDWVLLRPQFAEAARRARSREAESIADSSSADRQLTLMATMGGSDPAGLTLMALEAIEHLDGDLRVLVVVGSGFMHESALADWLTTAKRTYEICRNVANMASLMAEVDLAVASFGVTAYELAVMGVPSVYLCLTDDHAESATIFSEAGIGVSLGNHKKVSVDMLTAAIADLYLSNVTISALSENKVEIPDGLGAIRLAGLIHQCYDS